MSVEIYMLVNSYSEVFYVIPITAPLNVIGVMFFVCGATEEHRDRFFTGVDLQAPFVEPSVDGWYVYPILNFRSVSVVKSIYNNITVRAIDDIRVGVDDGHVAAPYKTGRVGTGKHLTLSWEIFRFYVI